jgi:hypothetical protein
MLLVKRLVQSSVLDFVFVTLKIFLEQKKMLKTGLNIARFRVHVPMIEEETIAYFKRWGNSGDKGLLECPVNRLHWLLSYNVL